MSQKFLVFFLLGSEDGGASEERSSERAERRGAVDVKYSQNSLGMQERAEL